MNRTYQFQRARYRFLLLLQAVFESVIVIAIAARFFSRGFAALCFLHEYKHTIQFVLMFSPTKLAAEYMVSTLL
jgi:hypothetical protein